jgi:hypothetical protein
MMAVLVPPSIKQQGFLLSVQVFRVEDLPKMDWSVLGTYGNKLHESLAF